MDNPTIAWSHSRVNSFLTCPLKMYEETIAKNYPFQENEASRWGKKVHKALERRLAFKAELPSNMVQYEKHAANVESMHERIGGQILCEQQMAVNKNLKPCGWFSKETWARCITDVSIVNPERGCAIAIDWKTGKKKDDDRQLALQAAFIFRHYPTIDKVMSAFCWLKEGGAMVHMAFVRANETRLWKQYLPVVRELTDAAELGVWPAKPSGLCREYCAVSSCKHNGMYKK